MTSREDTGGRYPLLRSQAPFSDWSDSGSINQSCDDGATCFSEKASICVRMNGAALMREGVEGGRSCFLHASRRSYRLDPLPNYGNAAGLDDSH